MQPPKLTICIPTYNRCEFLAVLLESIASQADPAIVEIAISDNCSSDSTSVMIENFRSKYQNITYFVSEKNVGPDENYMRSVEISSGEYCWLMGSDDLIPHGAIARVLELIGKTDVVLFDRMEATYDLAEMKERRWLPHVQQERVFQFVNENEKIAYFGLCQRLGGVFSYLSSIVVRRSSWDSVKFDRDFIGTAYPHAFILLSLIEEGGALLYVPESLVISRSGNDCFYTDWTSRALIDFYGYKKLAHHIFSCPCTRRAFLSIMHGEYSSYALIKTKVISQSPRWNELARIAQNDFLFKRRVFLLADLAAFFGRPLLLYWRLLKSLSIQGRSAKTKEIF